MSTLFLRVGLAGLTLLSAASAWAGAGGPDGTMPVRSVPEPASIALLAAGIGGIFALRRRMRRK